MFKINNIEWLIKFVQPWDDIFITPTGDITVGTCDNDTKIIYLSTSLKNKELKKVLCHEIVHAAMFSYDIRLDYEQAELLANLIATYGEEIIKITNDMFKRLYLQ